MTYVKPKIRLTNAQTLKILDTPWLTKYDVMQLAFCGDAVATRHMQNIRQSINDKGKFLPDKSLIPTEEAIKYFSINIAQLKK